MRGFESGTLGPRNTPATGTYASAGQAYYSDRTTEALGGNILITGARNTCSLCRSSKTTNPCGPPCSGMWARCIGQVLPQHHPRLRWCGPEPDGQFGGGWRDLVQPAGAVRVSTWLIRFARRRTRINRCSSFPWARRSDHFSGLTRCSPSQDTGVMFYRLAPMGPRRRLQIREAHTVLE